MNPSEDAVAWLDEYRALTAAAGLVDLGHRTQIELAGADRASFLHNLSTNEIRKLAVGSGVEAFLTSVQGKTLAHGFVFAGETSLVFETVGGQSAAILKHLDHYLVCEQVELFDRSQEWSELLLAGPAAASLLASVCEGSLPQFRLAHCAASIAGQSVSVRRVEWTGPEGFLISGKRDAMAAVRTAFVAAGAVSCGEAAFTAARIEWGLPLFGSDITEANLPQEVGRDPLAISFTKGCYLGQETVARIDALGHVNKTLVGVRFHGTAVPPVGSPLSAGGQVVGQVRSSSFSPGLNAGLALGYVRRGSNQPGAALTSAVGQAEVVALPVR
jgi:hypothetical protein